MLKHIDIEQFYKRVEGLGLKFPIADIAKATNFSKGNISDYINKRREPSRNFLTAFDKAFPESTQNVPRGTNLTDFTGNKDRTIEYLAYSNKVLADNNSEMIRLHKELVELEAAPANPIWDISKKQVTKRIKKVLDPDQRKKVNEHLRKSFPRFHKFIHLYFHSGGRMPELIQLKPGMVDLQRQKYRCIIKKGKQYKEVERTIKTIALPYWEFFLQDCPADNFIFGPLFKAAAKAIGVGMPSRYWRKLVKEGLGIDVDMYALKHLNTSEVVDALDEKDAAKLNAHTSEAMVIKIYDVKQKERQHERLKDLKNGFA